MNHPSMPLTTDDAATDSVDGSQHDGSQHSAREPQDDADRIAEGDSGGQTKLGDSGYDVISSAASPHHMRGPKRWDLFVLFNIAIPILLILVGYLIVRAFGVATAKPLPPPDTSVAAVLKSLPETRVERIRSLQETGEQLELVIDGNVVPYREANLSSEVAGRVIYKSPACEAGAVVTAGEVLMRIDPTDYELEVERLSRQREQEYRALGEVDQEMANTRRSIEVAREDVKLQRKELERQTALKEFASQAEVDRAKGGLLQSSQQLVTLENQLDLLRSRRSRLEASEQFAATQLRSAEVNLARCEITAPISGVIVSEQADVNTFVNRGTPLLIIEDTSKVEVAATMRMDQLQWVLDQDDVSDAGTGYDLPDTPAIIEYEVAGRRGEVYRWHGTLVSYDGIGIDPNTRTVPVRILVDDPTHFVDDGGRMKRADRTNTLMRGMFVRVRLQLKPRTDLVVVPARALRPGNRVWKFESDPAMLRKAVAEARRKAAEVAEGRGEQSVTADEDAVSAESAVPAESNSNFDPEQWQAGLVTLSGSVYPIDSLQLSGDEGEDQTEVAPSLKTTRRWWVCESNESDLAGGDYVVVSPLNSVPPEGVPARAETSE